MGLLHAHLEELISAGVALNRSRQDACSGRRTIGNHGVVLWSLMGSGAAERLRGMRSPVAPHCNTTRPRPNITALTRTGLSKVTAEEELPIGAGLLH